MAKGKVLQAIVEIAGSVSPTLAKAVKETGDKLGKVNLKALAVGAAASAGAVAIGKAAVDAGKYLVDLGSQFDAVTDSIRIGTGATGDALDSLMADFDAVYSSVPTTMDDASKAIADYNTRLGLTGEELQGVSTQAIQVADMLGEDLGGVIESSSKAFQQWNIDAKDMGGAMDYVFKASQSTGVGFSELMTSVQSFGPQLQNMGYSFEEATALVGQLEKAGVNTEEVLGAMKKSTAALAKEGIGASKGMEMYAKAITNAKDMTKATEIATEIFGTRAASTMAAAIRDGSISVDELTKSLTENNETIGGCAADTYDYAEQMQLFKQKAQVALEPLGATMFNALNDMMPMVSDLFEALIPIIQDLTSTLIPLVTDIGAEIGPMLAEFLPPLLKMGSVVAKQVIPPLVNIIKMVLPSIIRLSQMLIPIIEFVAVSILPAVIQVVEKLLPPIMTVIEIVLPIILNLMQTLMPILLQLIDTVLPVIVYLINMVAQVMQLLAPIIQWVGDLFGQVLGGAIQSLSPILDALMLAFSGLMDFITGIFTGNWEQAWNGVVNIFKGIFNLIPSLVESVINGAIDLINGIIKGINSVADYVGLEIALIPHVKLPRFAAGGFTEGMSIAGEAGMEAVISFDPAYRDENIGYWLESGKLLGVLDNASMNTGGNAAAAASMQMAEAEAGTQETPQLAQAGKLMALDNFSLGQLTESTVIYYDFSGLSYAPQVEAGASANKDDILAALKQHASEFFDWLEAWLKQKEVGEYDRVSIY